MSSAKILVVDDEADIRGLVQEILTEEGYDVEAAANAAEARQARSRSTHDLVLLDIWMPDVDGITLLREWSSTLAQGAPVVMMSGHGTVETAIEATRLGAFDFVEKPLSLAKLLRTVERALDAGRRRRSAGRVVGAAVAAPVGRSRVMQQLRAELVQLAPLAAPVLLVGEHGSGREAFARFLHENSGRSERPFIVLVASSLRDEEAEASLLGNGDGDGGVLDRVAGGTLFINEIEDLPPAAQRTLLGVLETGVYRRGPGGPQAAFEARVLSSALPGVLERAGAGPLRRDLLGKLNGLQIRVPSLREYAEDVPELLRHTVDRLVDGEGLGFRRFSVPAQNRLRNYPWPDNMRELRNFVHRLLLTGGPEEIGLEEIERELGAHSAAVGQESLVKQDLLAMPLREAREHFERAYLQQQLLLCNGRVGQLAKRVGMERTHLYRKLRSLGVDFKKLTED
jgi:DNA-binding NtrC family response regulator